MSPLGKAGRRWAVASLGTCAVGAITLAGAAGPAAAAGSSVQQIESSLKASSHSTFKATYTSDAAGQTEKLVIERVPHKELLSVNGSFVLTSGKKTYYCTAAGGSRTCVTSSGSDPLAGLVQAFSPAGLEAAFSSGSGLKLSKATYAGQPSKCITETADGQTEKFCVTKTGVIAAVSTTGEHFTLTGYSTHVPAKDFAVPSGGSSVSLPGGVSIP